MGIPWKQLVFAVCTYFYCYDSLVLFLFLGLKLVFTDYIVKGKQYKL